LHPALAPIPTFRVIPGPQAEEFAPDALTALCSAPYQLLPDSNRMGYRLQGPSLHHKRRATGISDAVTIGALQVPPDQQPMLLMADRQTTGGYPKIGVVISVDLPLAAQVMPGDHVQFITTTVEHAVALARTRWAQLSEQLPHC
jgi:antagonist of KipI